tara:strand:+ start:7969 stop:10383 length:2415 start_codon:yes stop_codon:yes gene_type:complete
MKNKMKKIILVLLFLIFSPSINIADEILIEAKTLDYDKKNEIIKAEGDVVANDQKSLIIKAQKIDFLKKKNLLKAEKFVEIVDTENNIKLNSNYIYFETIKGLITSEGETKIVINDNYNIKSKNVLFNRKEQTIESKFKTEVKDNLGNTIIMNNFFYSHIKKTFRSANKIKIVDNLNNSYYFDDVLIDIEKGSFAGNKMNILFDKSTFGDNRNDPRMSGNYSIVEKDKTIINKGVFTTCELKKDKCPPWKIRANRIIHDKKKKTIYYKKAWLDLYDVPIVYFPAFFHPDPTVKRQSGFLAPNFYNSKKFGSSFSLPYYHVFADNKDFTISPKIYSDENPVVQTEYRVVTKNSKTTIDASYNQGYKYEDLKKTPGSRNHFFMKSLYDLKMENFDYSLLEMNIQRSSNETYLKVHNINSPLIDDKNLLHSNITMNLNKDLLDLDINIDVFEDLGKDSGKYEYILPSINYKNNLAYFDDFGSIDHSIKAKYKNYDSNVNEGNIINDFNWNSNNFYSNSGLISKFESTIKNNNYHAKESANLKNNKNVAELATAIGYTTYYPLEKKTDTYEKILTPKFMLRYAPGGMRDLSNSQLRLTTENLFSLNKLNNDDVIEDGASISVGSEYAYNNTINKAKNFKMSLGQVFNLEENLDMPTQSSLNNRSSELVAKLDMNFNKNFALGYNLSADNNYKSINYNEVNGLIKFKNLITQFDYLEENNFIGRNRSLSSSLSLEISDSKKLGYKIRKNFVTDSTEFYNLSYQYSTDCLTAGIEFNRSYYLDKDIEQEDALMFKLTFIPFGDISTPSLK